MTDQPVFHLWIWTCTEKWKEPPHVFGTACGVFTTNRDLVDEFEHVNCPQCKQTQVYLAACIEMDTSDAALYAPFTWWEWHNR